MEGRGNLHYFYPLFRETDDTHCRSSRLHAGILQKNLRFIDPCNFQSLDRFRYSWQVLAVYLWNSLPADILLSGDNYGWRTTLKQAQHHVLRSLLIMLYMDMLLRIITVQKLKYN